MATIFPTTRWSVVLDATAGPGKPPKALAELCEAYWRPLFVFLRRDGMAVADAEDAVQGFLSSLMSGASIGGAQPERGRFRSYLLGALRHWLANERTRARAAKRGGVEGTASLDVGAGEIDVPDDRTPEGAYAFAWATEILGRARRRLGATYGAEGHGPLFAALEPFLLSGDTPAYRQVAESLGMTEATARVAVHRLRGRFRAALRSEVADTVSSEADIDDELRAVIEALRGPGAVAP